MATVSEMASQPMTELAARPLRPPPTLTSLPAEILSMIGRLIDKPTSLSLARVSPMFTLAAESGIWETLDLFLPPWYTDPPRVAAYFRRNGNVDRFDPTLAEHHRLGDEAHKLAITKRISGILSRAEERHWRMVKRVRAVPREGTADAVLQLLGYTAPTLYRLDLASPSSHDYDNQWELESHMITARLHFPSLTHITLGSSVADHHSLIPILCNASPSLLSLDLAFNHFVQDWPEAPDVPTFERDTGIRKLRIVFTDGVAHPDDFEPEPIQHELLKHIPLIEELSTNCHMWCEFDDAFVPLVSALKGYGHLRDVRWHSKLRHGSNYIEEEIRLIERDGNDQAGIGMQRLLLSESSKWSKWTEVFYNLPHLPSLETLYIDTGSDHTLQLPSLSGLRWLTRDFLAPDFTAQLRRCPQLSVIQDVSPLAIPETPDLAIQLDKVDQAAKRRGHVWSIIHDGHELLHVGMWILVKPTYSETDDWVWVERYSDFKGIYISREIIQEMKEMEGGGAEYWERRGAVIGKKAWKVLLDWTESLEWSSVNAETGEWEGKDRG